MLIPNIITKQHIFDMLISYYETLNQGDLQAQASLMTRSSYLINLASFGTKRAFHDPEFRHLLKTIEHDDMALKTVEAVLSSDLKKEARTHDIALDTFIANGSERITVKYFEDGHPKNIHFSLEDGEWKINYKAGRKVG